MAILVSTEGFLDEGVDLISSSIVEVGSWMEGLRESVSDLDLGESDFGLGESLDGSLGDSLGEVLDESLDVSLGDSLGEVFVASFDCFSSCF